ncbi:MAG: hypothetical protein B7Y25_03565 [Alphaproteobacteria bacterium 16-39-46]|nr:MAG: hypothetical protein B7Y25_03565 [Alphaproteobacteria bacterium 16-39-46]OZA43238.1 MAG: hypothetical protein B7X84_03790 [Alphaproteobacteria bacterium 17-39-52]HQS83994.1 hypothetical protein [Alphaproteobacteria bacterium]HQS93865.1 hypothetical protein [Alphaproteobacteria bacterium]
MAFFSKKSFIRSHLLLAVLGSVTFSFFNSYGMDLSQETKEENSSSISSVSQRQPSVEALTPLEKQIEDAFSLMKIKYLEHDKKKRTGDFLLSILEDWERVLPVTKRIEIFEEIMCEGTHDQRELAYPALFSFFERTDLPIEDRVLLGKSILIFCKEKEQKRGILSFFLSCIEEAHLPLQTHVNDALEVLYCRADSALHDRANAALFAIVKNPQSSLQDYINVLQTFLSRSWCWDTAPEDPLQIIHEKLLSSLEREDVPLEARFHYGTLLLDSSCKMEQEERVRDAFLSILEQPESARSLTDVEISRRFKFHISRRGNDTKDISVFEDIIERGTSAQKERGKNLLLSHLEHDERSRSLTNEHINAFRFYYSFYNSPREENLFENIRTFGTPQQKIRAYLILKGKGSFLEAQLDFLRSVLLPKAEDFLRFVPPGEDLLHLALHSDSWHSFPPHHEIEGMFRVLRDQDQQEWGGLIEQTIRSCALRKLELTAREEAQIAQNLRESRLKEEQEEEEKKKRAEDALIEAIRETQRYERAMECLFQARAQWEEQAETARVNAINWDDVATQRDQAASMEVHDYARSVQKGMSLHDAVLGLIDLKLQEKESLLGSPLILISYEEALQEIESWIRNEKNVPLGKQANAFRAIKKGLEEVPNAKRHFSKVFTFMKFNSDKMEIWMNGFVGESLSAYETKDSCSPGIEERIVMGVRGVNDEIDLMFKKAETRQAAKTFLTNCNFGENESNKKWMIQKLLDLKVTEETSPQTVGLLFQAFGEAHIRSLQLDERNEAFYLAQVANFATILEDFYESKLKEAISLEIRNLLAVGATETALGEGHELTQDELRQARLRYLRREK